MMDENKIVLAKEVYDTLCSAIDNRKWKYQKEEENLTVFFGVNTDDIPMNFILVVDVERQIVRLMSPMPFNMCEEKRLDGAIAVCVASLGLVDGNFDYNFADGRIVFRMTTSFKECVIGEGLFDYMISCSCVMVDEYNEKFFAINEGLMSIEEFIAKTE